MSIPLALKAGYLVNIKRINLLNYSESFDNARWLKYEFELPEEFEQTLITPDATNSPEGTLTADKVSEVNSSQDQNWGVSYETPPTLIPSTQYTFSVRAKYAGRKYMQISYVSLAFDFYYQIFDLQAGTFGFGDNGVGGQITPEANGFYRCSISGDSGIGLQNRVQLTITLRDDSGTALYSGTDDIGIYLSGAQFEIGSLSTYQRG